MEVISRPWSEYTPTIARIEASVSHRDALEVAEGYARWIRSIGLVCEIEDSTRDDWDYDSQSDITIQTVAVTVQFRNWYFAQNTKLGEAVKSLGLRWQSKGSVQSSLTASVFVGNGDDLAVVFMVAECDHHSAARNNATGLRQLGWAINKIVYPT